MKSKRKTPSARPTKKRYGLFALYILYVLILLELFSRGFLTIRYKASFFDPGDYIYGFYPELKMNVEALEESDYADFRVLVLGGSVISHEFCPIDSILHRRLYNQTTRPIRVYNLASRAHTSLDSYYKYERLKNYRWDLVILYHNINELRANNCPPGKFRDDYSHYAWYHELNTFHAHPEMNVVTFPLSLHLLYNTVRQWMGMVEYLPRHSPKPEMVRFGTDIRSAVPFRHYMSGILDMAREKRDKVLLMTFAYHIPQDYEYEKFKEKQLDYSDHTHPLELWGSPAGVVEGLAVHNEIIRDLANEYSETVCFFDQNARLTKGKVNFRDVCHLTLEGGVEFVDNLQYDLPPCLWPEY